MALLFLDVVGAFASVLRRLALPSVESDVDVARLAFEMGIEPEFIHEISRVLEEPPAMDEMGSHPYVNALVANAHGHTWFTTHGLSNAVHARLGSRAGDPFGDFIFGCLLARVTRDVEHRMRHEGLMPELPLPEATCPFRADPEALVLREVPSVQYVDDVVVPLLAASSAALLAQLRAAIPIVVDAYSRHALELNFSQGKSELVLALRGAGSKEVKQNVFKDHPPCIEVSTRSRGTVRVRIVRVYRHLGARVGPTSNLNPEVANRISSASSVYRPLSSRVFGAQWASSAVRLSLADSLHTSRLLFNSEVWPPLSPAAGRRLQASYMKVLRRISGRMFYASHDALLTDQSVMTELGVGDVALVMRRRRLGYLARFLSKAPPLLVALAAANSPDQGSWAKQLLGDLTWMRARSRKCDSLPDPALDQDAWCSFVRAFPGQWKAIVHDAVASHGSAGIRPHVVRNDVLACRTTCYECGQTFVSKAAMATHAYRRHGYQNPARKFSPGTSCECCLREFWTRVRLIHHLSCSSKACLARIMDAVPPLAPEVQEELDRQDAAQCRQSNADGFHVKLALRPSVLLAGPSRVP